MKNNPSPTTEFDSYAADYELALAEGLSISGEDKNYFSQGRIAWLARCLRQLVDKPRSALDFGCGTGSATPYLSDLIGVESVLGLDVSAKSLDVAKRSYGSERAQFLLFNQYHPSERIDLAYCNGFSTIFQSVAVPPWSNTSAVYCGQADCSRFGKTTLGIRARVM